MDIDNVLLFATGNQGKRREFEHLLADFLNPVWELYDLRSWPEPMPDIEETGETFRDNAFIKAETASLLTGATAMADDSGLEVDALEGKPGVHSARFAGPDANDEDNNRKLVRELEGVPEAQRTARYVCVLALVLSAEKLGRALLDRAGVPFEDVPEARPVEEGKLGKVDERVYIWFRGTVEGKILEEPRGEGGFGYDPYFYVPQWGETMAEVSIDKKNEISHRAEASRKLGEFFPAERNP